MTPALKDALAWAEENPNQHAPKFARIIAQSYRELASQIESARCCACGKLAVHGNCGECINVEVNRLCARAEAAESARDFYLARIREFDKSIDAEMRDPNGTIWEVANQFHKELEAARKELAEAYRAKSYNEAANSEYVNAVYRERDEARVEVANLTEELNLVSEQRDSLAKMADEARAEVDRLKAALVNPEYHWKQQWDIQSKVAADAREGAIHFSGLVADLQARISAMEPVVEAAKKYRGDGLDHRGACAYRIRGIVPCNCGMNEFGAALAALRGQEKL